MVPAGRPGPSTPVKFAIGLLGIGGSFVIMASPAPPRPASRVSPLWLSSVYLVQTLAELFLSPVGLSVTTKLAPARFASQMMGLWFLATATGNAVGGYVVRLNGALGDAVYYGLLGALAGGGRRRLPVIRATYPETHGRRRPDRCQIGASRDRP